tara:strand:+ start:17917 stop:18159 length:243 start_codon:yes stop_codon:yes gene_type:complete
MSENNSETQLQEEELVTMAKKAHLSGWLTQSVASGQSPEDAEKSFKANNERADAYMAKLAKVRETILEQAKALQEEETEK